MYAFPYINERHIGYISKGNYILSKCCFEQTVTLFKIIFMVNIKNNIKINLYFNISMTLFQMFATRHSIPEFRTDLEKYFQMPIGKRPGFMFLNSGLASWIFFHLKHLYTTIIILLAKVFTGVVAKMSGFNLTHSKLDFSRLIEICSD